MKKEKKINKKIFQKSFLLTETICFSHQKGPIYLA